MRFFRLLLWMPLVVVMGGVQAFVVSPSVTSKHSFSSVHQNSPFIHRNNAPGSSCLSSSRDAAKNTHEEETTQTASSSTSSSPTQSAAWAKHALLISSFTDGIMANPKAQAFLKYSVACSLLSERVRQAEAQVRNSVLASPCNGPCMEAFDSLEAYDQILARMSRDDVTQAQTRSQIDSSSDTDNDVYTDAAAHRLLEELKTQQKEVVFQIRLLYIPTAMYALNPQSKNTPGKQRQRLRVDAKQRRNLIVQHLRDLLPGANVMAITLDLDDGSLKQPEGGLDGNDGQFPKDGIEALTTWAPHIVYVEGGNTFWLQHCLEKGNWGPYIQAACTGPDAASVYIGKSAGAIISGATVETATWKEWDDPSVVPGKETYGDWKGYPGLAMVGPQSFFPHMSEDWETLVKQKRHEMDNDELAKNVICLHEWDACCVDGNAQKRLFLSGEVTTTNATRDWLATRALMATTSVVTTDAFLPQKQQQELRTFIPNGQYQSSTATTSFLKSASDGNDYLQTETTSSSSPSPPPTSEAKGQEQVKPIILDPFPEAADPMYIVRGPIGQGDFVISREGGPTKEELANENILRIVKSECTDLEVNTLVWKALGYRFDPEKKEWNSSECFPNWSKKYPTPPDLIGMQRIYSREVDQISLRSNQALVRSVPADNKQSLKKHLKPLGWKGYQYKELTPNLTRRAQCANWLVFFREELFGYSVEELRERRQQKKEAEELKRQQEGSQEEWSPPVREVY